MAIKNLSDVHITAGLQDKDGQLGTSGQILSSTGSQVNWINQSDIVTGPADEANSLIIRVKNSTATAMTKGQVVCAAVSASPPSGNLIEVALADNNGTNTMPAVGILKENLDASGGANDEGDAVMFGKVSGINTSAFSVGDEVFIDDTPGGLTITKPTGTKYIQKVGVVIRDHSNNGTIEVFGAGRVNDVPTPLYVDHANQRLGIGATSPQAKLHVANGTLRTWTPIAGTSAIFESTVNSRNFITIAAANEAEIWFGDASSQNKARIRYEMAGANMEFWTNGGQKMVINSSGNLGIGTTSPSKRLQVSHADANNGLLLEHTSQASGFQILQNIRQTEGLIWQKQTNDSFTSNLMTLGYDGDLGIGTTSPGSLLHVEGSRTTAALQVNQTGTGVIANFKQGGSSKVLIDNSGNVGIGTTSLSNKLQVTGSTQSTDFKVGSSGTMQIFDYSGNLHIYSTAGTDILLGGGIGGRQNDVVIGNGDLRVSGSVKMGNDSDAASAGKAGALRYRVSGNNSYVDMCMRTGATTYAWVNIVQNNW